MTEVKRAYGWKPDLPDFRDFEFDKVAKPVVLPASMDLRAQCPPVVDQGNYSSCVSNACTSDLEFLEIKEKVAEAPLSRFFLYYNCRADQGDIKQDDGTTVREAIKMLAKYGVCLESSWPYTAKDFSKKPSAACYTKALPHKISSYYRISGLNSMLTCLAGGNTFVFGFSVYDSFESDQVAATGVVNLPAAGEQLLGGHCVMAVGYNQSASRFLVRNSWGTSWGMSGYFTIPYAYLTNTNLADDFWYVVK